MQLFQLSGRAPAECVSMQPVGPSSSAAVTKENKKTSILNKNFLIKYF
jgi:hypothetical protein